MTFRSLLIIFVAIASLLFSCKSNPADQLPVVTIVHPANVDQNQKIPLPKSDILLTVEGKVQNVNKANQIVMDRQAIESLELVEYKIFDTFEKKTNTFQGVRLTDLVALWHIPPDATKLEFTALNDYRITVPIDVIKKVPILFALKQNGEYMKRNYRGPAMLILPPGDVVLEFPRASYWIWQISKITVQ